jgi:diguanylate cyclase (GGDEF)-like protein/PAS domain S-box-containing protein
MPKHDSPSGPNPTTEASLDPAIYRQAVEVAPVPMIVVRTDGSIVLVNEAAVTLFGYEEKELVGEPIENLVPDGLRPTHRTHRDAYTTEATTRPMGGRRDLMAVAKDGRLVPVEIGLSPIDTSAGLMVICAVVDITSRLRTEEELAELAALLGEKNKTLLELVATDSLTSLRSRRAFLDHLAGQVESAARNARPLSILILDIDEFKRYNDGFGHLAGDEVLRLFGKILRNTARRSDLVARLGGEEFGIVLPETNAEGARTLAERFRQAIEEARWPRRPITASVGATTVTFDHAVPRPPVPEVSGLLGKADRALYASKQSGRNRVTHSLDLPPQS